MGTLKRSMLQLDRVSVFLTSLNRCRDVVQDEGRLELHSNVGDPPKAAVGDHDEGPGGTCRLDASHQGDVLAFSDRQDLLIGSEVTSDHGIASVDALAQGVRKTAELTMFTVKMLGRIVIGEASIKNISGPITMAEFAGQSAQAGALVFVGYLALISISLGVLNLMPVPLLDGGHLLYYFAEIVKGSPVSDRAFEVGQRIGMAMLAVLMALALFNDLSRLF